MDSFRRITRSLLTTFFPIRCAGCDILLSSLSVNPIPNEPAVTGPITDQTHEGAGATDNGFDTVFRSDIQRPATEALSQWVCPECIDGWSPVRSPICGMCGMPFKSRQGSDHMCGECLRRPKNFQMARAACLYTQLTMALVHGFKYNHKIQLARPLGAVLALTFVKFWKIEDIDLIVPVPLHPRRFRQRGFNQAYLLAKVFNRQIQKIAPHSAPAVLEKGAVCRIRPTASQTGLQRKGRFDNIRNAFKVVKPALIYEQRILLIDDIYTTGATVDECAKVLLSNGASRIDVLTVARAV